MSAGVTAVDDAAVVAVVSCWASWSAVVMPANRCKTARNSACSLEAMRSWILWPK
jgi:hypothetical protein